MGQGTLEKEMSKNGKRKKEKYLCSECHKEYVKHPDMLCESCYNAYVFEVYYPPHPDEEEIK